MTKISLPCYAACAVITTLLLAPIPGRAQDDKPKSPLAQQMGGMAKDIRALHKIVNDPAQKETALGLIKDMEAHATKAEGFEPVKTKEIPPAGKAQFLADYKKQMDGLIADFQKLEAAVSAGNTADASALLDKLGQDKREGHKKFNAEDEDGPGGPRPPGNMPPPPGNPPPQ